jgi:hypothetical protein
MASAIRPRGRRRPRWRLRCCDPGAASAHAAPAAGFPASAAVTARCYSTPTHRVRAVLLLRVEVPGGAVLGFRAEVPGGAVLGLRAEVPGGAVLLLRVEVPGGAVLGFRAEVPGGAVLGLRAEVPGGAVLGLRAEAAGGAVLLLRGEALSGGRCCCCGPTRWGRAPLLRARLMATRRAGLAELILVGALESCSEHLFAYDCWWLPHAGARG